MLWARGRSCVGGMILVFLAGCAGQQIAGFGLFELANGEQYMVSGAPGEVALTFKDNLRRLGLSADITQQGEDIRIAGKTPKGDKFALLLKRVEVQVGDTPVTAKPGLTQVRFQWEKGPDEQTRTQVLAGLNVQSSTVSPK